MPGRRRAGRRRLPRRARLQHRRRPGRLGGRVTDLDEADLHRLPQKALPAYTVLVPLHRAAAVLPALLERLAGLDHPAASL
ncbi:hypothetical protein ACU635_23210 [[Actinomadura] parvosata]|uniref:hypothetical protein n=1 Tax=[Actinomadura] parvosata TaxID=1955412 RepID=UPI00406C320D